MSGDCAKDTRCDDVKNYPITMGHLNVGSVGSSRRIPKRKHKYILANTEYYIKF